MSVALQNGTRFVIAPVAGLVTSPERPASDPAGLPPIHRGTVSAASTGLFIGSLLLAEAGSLAGRPGLPVEIAERSALRRREIAAARPAGCARQSADAARAAAEDAQGPRGPARRQ